MEKNRKFFLIAGLLILFAVVLNIAAHFYLPIVRSCLDANYQRNLNNSIVTQYNKYLLGERYLDDPRSKNTNLKAKTIEDINLIRADKFDPDTQIYVDNSKVIVYALYPGSSSKAEYDFEGKRLSECVEGERNPFGDEKVPDCDPYGKYLDFRTYKDFVTKFCKAK